jgi:hypothetical protein
VSYSRVVSQTIDDFPGKNQYYIFIEGIKSKYDILAIEALVKKKSEVKLFISDHYPVRFFLLKSDNLISKSIFQSWIGKEFQVKVFGLGKEYKEEAIMVSKKTIKNIKMDE